ncbi:hypothetical protein [Mucilaginibacter flavidus]|uniref:hypothetical protein n=1 Tax=Mucilaginibacter flavidus TaxID=2949309 RepID=UPI002093A150|nr:hypothetical protein [Mucilaginibacter flavidus]MCO5946723.1 hypothetical protein [Mucilaginibacter flavidus]
MDFRQRLEQSRVQLVGGTSEFDPDEHFTSLYFATERGSNPLCLDLRLPDGSRKAVPYSYFTEINFDADAGIEILTTQKRISVTGRNLKALYEHLITYRVRYVQANIGNDTEEDGLFVEEIRISEP